ncbi:MAG: type II toxin-antitoxin system YafQ family toxin [Thermosynechococcaceae cyanobacterium]
MLNPSYSKQFERDLKKMLKQGKNGGKIKGVIRSLINEEPLAPKYKDHKLIGNYKGRRECHVEPDWLLVYKKMIEQIVFERTGTHSDLFK